MTTNSEPIKISDNDQGKFIRTLSESATDDQWIREFVYNSIEAIQDYQNKFPEDKGFEGEVLITRNEEIEATIELGVDNSNVVIGRKICVIDNGIGMDPKSMITNLRGLGQSGQSKANNEHENYGVGAKIASVTRNGLGVVFWSWEKDQPGYGVWLHHDQNKDIYGAKRKGNDQGKFEAYYPLHETIKPPLIKESGHGTVVTLLGMKPEDDTMSREFHNIKSGQGAADSWIHSYLNKRFYSIPNNVKLRVASTTTEVYAGKRGDISRIIGLKNVLDKSKVEFGTEKLSDAVIDWWILKDDKGKGRNTREYRTGHSAVIFENEVFDLTSGRGNKAKLLFDIPFPTNIAFHIKPIGENFKQNNTRSEVLCNRDKLPYERWSNEWEIPKKLSDYLKAEFEKVSKKFADTNDVEKKLMQFKDFFHLPRWRQKTQGSVEIDPELTEPSSVGINNGNGNISPNPEPNSYKPEVISTAISLQTQEGSGTFGDPESISIPHFIWDNEDSSSVEDGILYDRIAYFDEVTNTVYANQDFVGLTWLITTLHQKEFKNINQEYVDKCVKDEFKQRILETVNGVRALESRQNWTSEQYNNAISPESLTASVQARISMIESIRSKLSEYGSKGIDREMSKILPEDV